MTTAWAEFSVNGGASTPRNHEGERDRIPLQQRGAAENILICCLGCTLPHCPMKRSLWFLLIVSMSVNALIAAALAMRRPTSSPVIATNSSVASQVPSDMPARADGTATMTPNGAGVAGGGATDALGTTRSLWDVLSSRDPATFAANLHAAGFALGSVRGAIYALLRDLQTADRLKAVDLIPVEPYWKSPVGREGTVAYGKEITRLWLERDRIMRGIFPEEQQAFILKMQARFGPIAEDKMERISALDQDYSEMRMQIGSQSGSGFRMPWSGEQLNYLEQEKIKDLAALLTPQELEQFQMRGSSTGMALQRQLVGFEATEQEYREIYRLRAAFDQANRAGMTSGMTPEGIKAQKDLTDQLKSALGETRYADYERTTDYGYQSATSAAQRLGLPATTANAVYQLQRDVQQRGAAINGDPSQTATQRETQLTALTAEAKQKLSTLLTPAGVEQYMRETGGFTLVVRPAPPGR